MNSITNIGNKYQEVKHRLNIIDVATKLGSKLTQQGRNTYHGTCPTGHASKSGTSFHVDSNQQVFHCFNCGIGGDIFTLVEKVYNLSSWEALKWLVDEYNLKIDLGKPQHNPKPSPEEIKKKEEQIKKSMILEGIYEIGKEKLYSDESKDELKYLTEDRGYDIAVLKDTEWFYLPEDFDIKKELINENPVWKSDVGKLKLQGYFGDNFRLAFPYRNSEGLITGFLKRATDPKGISVTTFDGRQHEEVRWDSTPKVTKADLFGIDKISIEEDTLIIVEGYPDAIYLKAMGIENIVAVGQGRLSKSHLITFRSKKIKNVIISFDNDKVGPSNTVDAVKMILKSSKVTPYVIDPAEYGSHKDPDEFMKANGFDDLKKIFNIKPQHGLVWVVLGLIQDAKDANQIRKDEIKKEILELLSLTTEESTISNVLELVKKAFGDNIQSLKRQLKSQYKSYSDDLPRHIQEDPIIPMLDLNSNNRGYYNNLDGKLNLGIDKEFIEEVMLDHGLRAPKKYPSFFVKFDPKDMGDKFDHYNKTFNLFTPTKYMLMKGDNKKIDLEVSCPRTFELLRILIPVEKEREHFINWLSFVFTKRDKARTAWVLKGVQGSGKNLFFEKIIKPLFGQNQCVVVDDDRLQSDFNGYMNNKLFVAFNEVANDETKTKRSVKSKIKALISDDTVMVNEKHVRTYEMDNFANILFFSNEAIPLLIEEHDRRFNVIETGGPLKSVPSFVKNPHKFIDDLNNELDSFTQFLLNYNYDLFKVDMVLENEAKKELKELSMNKFELFAAKLKAGNFEWFEQYYPEPKSTQQLNDRSKLLMTEDELKSKKVEQTKLLRTFYQYSHTNSYDQGFLTKMMKIHGIKKFRERRATSSTFYYVW